MNSGVMNKMYKCTECGNEFEGKFCPYCGTKKVEEKLCPVCGAKAVENARFCNECGNPLFTPPPVKADKAETEEKPQEVRTPKPQKIKEPKERVQIFTEKRITKIFEYLRYAPFALFALFSVLLFAFFAAPVAVMPGGEIMGEKIPAESYGNVYTLYNGLLDDFGSVSGAMSALIICAVFSVLFACVMAVITFVPSVKGRKVALFGKSILLGNLLVYASFAFYLLFLVIGSVVAGKINSFDGGMGVISVGACSTLIIVFSILFAIFAAGSLVARYFLNRFFPYVSESEKLAADATEKARAERIAVIPAPVAPVVVSVLQSPSRPEKPQYMKTANGILSRKRTLIMLMISLILVSIMVILGSRVIGFGYYMGIIYSAFIIIIPLLLILLIAVRIGSGRKGYKQLSKITNKGTYITTIITAVIVVLLYCALVAYLIYLDYLAYCEPYEWWHGDYFTVEYHEYSYFTSMLTSDVLTHSPLLFSALIMLIIASVWYSKQKKFCLKMYGVKKPKKDTPLTEEGKAELNTVNEYMSALNRYASALTEYKTSVHNYKLYKRQVALYNCQNKLYAAGIDYTKYPKPVAWLFAHKLVAVLAVVIVMVGIILAIALPPALAPKESLEDLFSILLNIH